MLGSVCCKRHSKTLYSNERTVLGETEFFNNQSLDRSINLYLFVLAFILALNKQLQNAIITSKFGVLAAWNNTDRTGRGPPVQERRPRAIFHGPLLLIYVYPRQFLNLPDM